MKLMKPVTLVCAAALTAAGCANIGKINGYQIAQANGTTPPPTNETFCERNLALCIAGGIIIAGGASYGIHEAIDNEDNDDDEEEVKEE